MKYVYSTVRFVPDPARGEFVNVGALVGSEEAGEWRIRCVDNMRRARALDDRGALPAVWRFADDISRQIDAHEGVASSTFAVPELSERWLNQLWQEFRNVVQLSRPAPMVASTAEEALDIVFEELVVDPESRRFQFTTKTPVLRRTREAYALHGLLRGEHFAERREVFGPRHRQRFDFVVANDEVVQLSQGWSFQLPNQDQLSEDVKSWAWGVQDLRSGGGQLPVPTGSTLEVPSDVDVEAIYVPPAPGGPTTVLDEALSAFQALGVTASPMQQADLVAKRARDLLVDAGVPLSALGNQASFLPRASSSPAQAN